MAGHIRNMAAAAYLAAITAGVAACGGAGQPATTPGPTPTPTPPPTLEMVCQVTRVGELAEKKGSALYL
ncbi:hypothetical protein HYY74_06985 [Candidatus Woesearchaeota archaeon]|nr:hypothetical protein [Candidatus Woesearchaeota archaeon]